MLMEKSCIVACGSKPNAFQADFQSRLDIKPPSSFGTYLKSDGAWNEQQASSLDNTSVSRLTGWKKSRVKMITRHSGWFGLFWTREKNDSSNDPFCCHLNFRAFSLTTRFCCVNNWCQHGAFSLDGVSCGLQISSFIFVATFFHGQKIGYIIHHCARLGLSARKMLVPNHMVCFVSHHFG